MYTFLECLAIALVVLVKAGVRAVGMRSRQLVSGGTTGLREKLDTSRLARAAGEGD